LVTGPNPRALGVDADAEDLDGVIVEKHAEGDIRAYQKAACDE
jgi:hypothetical protein